MSTRTFEDVSDVLILRAIGLGDFLTAVPAYRGLRQKFPVRRSRSPHPQPLSRWPG